MRKTRETNPPTYTAGDVVRILHGKIGAQALIKWDEKGIFRPSFYFDQGAAGGVISVEERDKRLRSRGSPPRLYTFSDLVYLRLLVEVSDRLKLGKTPHACRRAAEIVSILRQRFPASAPSSSRMLVIGCEAYLWVDGQPECLTEGKQLPLAGVFTDEVAAELRGRIDLLTARDELGASEEPVERPTAASA